MSFHSSSHRQFCCAPHSITRDVVCCCVGRFVTFPIYVSMELALCRSFATSAPLLQKSTFLLLNNALLLLWRCLLIGWNMILYSFVSPFSYYIFPHFIISCMFDCWLPCVWITMIMILYQYVWVCRYDFTYSLIIQLFSSNRKRIW